MMAGPDEPARGKHPRARAGGSCERGQAGSGVHLPDAAPGTQDAAPVDNSVSMDDRSGVVTPSRGDEMRRPLAADVDVQLVYWSWR
jgi:hypothetical protein